MSIRNITIESGRTKLAITYEIDTMDWGSNMNDPCIERCYWALVDWFEGLTFKNQVAIAMSHRGFSDDNEDHLFDDMGACPWAAMVLDAENRVRKRHAPWSVGLDGHNLMLWVSEIKPVEQEATA